MSFYKFLNFCTLGRTQGQYTVLSPVPSVSLPSPEVLVYAARGSDAAKNPRKLARKTEEPAAQSTRKPRAKFLETSSFDFRFSSGGWTERCPAKMVTPSRSPGRRREDLVWPARLTGRSRSRPKIGGAQELTCMPVQTKDSSMR